MTETTGGYDLEFKESMMSTPDIEPLEESREVNAGLKKELGLFATVAIIVGQMIGSGIYMTPQGLAEITNPRVAILGMLITGLGTLFLALSFARLNNRNPVTGSAIVHTRDAFGRMPSFWVGWSYWCGCWTANGAIAVASVNYASYFFPSLAASRTLQMLAVLAIIWFYTLINIWGVKHAGNFNLILTVVKLLPILMFMVVAALNFQPAYLNTVSDPSLGGMSTLPLAMAYCLWSYQGFEGASITAGEVKDQSFIGKATVLSTILVMVLYILIITLAAGTMPQGDLAGSLSPLADIMHRLTGGYWAGALISLGGAISAFGCVGAWILSAGRVSYSLAQIDLLPEIFGRLDPKRGTPLNSLLINGVLMSVVMIFSYMNSSQNIYNFLVMLAVLPFLIFYLFGAASEIVLAGREIKPFNWVNFLKNTSISIIAFIYSLYTIYGSGIEYISYGFLLLLMGIPFFIMTELKIYHSAAR